MLSESDALNRLYLLLACPLNDMLIRSPDLDHAAESVWLGISVKSRPSRSMLDALIWKLLRLEVLGLYDHPMLPMRFFSWLVETELFRLLPEYENDRLAVAYRFISWFIDALSENEPLFPRLVPTESAPLMDRGSTSDEDDSIDGNLYDVLADTPILTPLIENEYPRFTDAVWTSGVNEYEHEKLRGFNSDAEKL